MHAPSAAPYPEQTQHRQLWNRVAAGWEKWWPVQERGLQPVTGCLVSLAEIRPGQRVLDIGTGIGEPALTAALKVGPGGSVVATDLAPEMLAIASKRAAALGLQNLEFQETAAEALDFPGGSFDAILARFSLMFVKDLDATLARLLQMLAPDGKFAAAVWDGLRRAPIITLAFELAKKMLPPPAAAEKKPSAFVLTEGVVEKALSQAGFSRIRTEILEATLEVASVKEFTQFLGEVNAPLLGLLMDHPAKLQAEYWQALTGEARGFARPDGGIGIPFRAICVAGARP